MLAGVGLALVQLREVVGKETGGIGIEFPVRH